MAAVTRESPGQFRVSFADIARKVRRGEGVEVDPYLVGRAIAEVMRACTVRSAAGAPLLWNEYRMVLARADFEPLRPLAGLLDRDLRDVLVQEARERRAELVGDLRVRVVFDEANELPAGQAVVRVAFVPSERLSAPGAGEMTVGIDRRTVTGQLESDATLVTPADSTVPVADHAGPSPGALVLAWPGGAATIPPGVTVVVGRPHPAPPARFIGLDGASPRISKQHLWIAPGTAGLRIGRFPSANPVQVDDAPLAPAGEVEVTTSPVTITLSRGDLVLTLSWG